MPTTLTVDDDIAKQLEKIARRAGKPLKAVVNGVLRAGIQNTQVAEATIPYRVEPAAMGEVGKPYDLDKALQLADHLEDEEVTRKLL